MLTTGWLGGHPESGVLLCYADRSLSAPEQERLAGHVNECEYCQRELAHIEVQARLVSAAMASVGTRPVSDIRKAQAWNAVRAAARRVERNRTIRTVWVPRLAAASIVLVAVSLFAGPGLALVRNAFGIRDAAPVVVAPAVVSVPAAPAPVSGSMGWTWRSPIVTIEFINRQAGTVEFRASSDDQVRVQATGASESFGMGRRRTGGDAIVIENDLSTSPVYIVSLPAHVTQITLSAAGKAQISLVPKHGIRYDIKELSAGRLTVVPSSKGY